jgi:hypothetical protein
LKLREVAALGVALVGDGIDFTLAAIPYLGEIIDIIDIPVDFIVPVTNAILLKDMRPLAGLTEELSVLIPGDLLDYLPIHTLSVLWVIFDKKNGKKK